MAILGSHETILILGQNRTIFTDVSLFVKVSFQLVYKASSTGQQWQTDDMHKLGNFGENHATNVELCHRVALNNARFREDPASAHFSGNFNM